MGEPDQGKLQLTLDQIQAAFGSLNPVQEAAVRHVLDQMSGKMRQMENVIRALQAQVPPPEPPEDEETAKLRLAREQFVANQKLREAAEPPAPRLPDPNQVFDARLRSVEVALAEVRDYMARSVTPCHAADASSSPRRSRHHRFHIRRWCRSRRFSTIPWRECLHSLRSGGAGC